MADPTRATAESQVWPGHAPVPTWETPMHLIGRGGLNLVDGIDQLDVNELARCTNFYSAYGSPLTVRPGQTALGTTAAGKAHSLFRLNDPAAGTFTRLVGTGTSLYRGISGALGSVDTGYSGDPLSFSAVNLPLAGTPYVFIGDRTRNRKISRTGSIEIIGTPPAVLTSVSVNGASTADIAQFDAADNTQAGDWTATAGQDRSATPNAGGVPVLTDVALGGGGNAVQMDTVVGAAVTGFDSIMSIGLSLDLTEFSPGVPIEDDDLIHLLFNVSEPLYLEEIKIYFVTSTFTAGEIPGASGDNVNAWYKAVRQNDFTDFHARLVSSTAASEELRTNQLLQQFKTNANVENPRASQVNQAGVTELRRQIQPQMQPGRNVWYQSGIIDAPIRRGDFARVGNDQTTGWDTITGIVIVVQSNAPQVLVVQFADWFVSGGSGPDTIDPGAQAYDYRVRNFNPITGSKGNPSAVQAESAWVNPHRQAVTVDPAASGIAAMRQQAFRRGGSATTSDDWRFVGQNASDGGTIVDTQSDDEILEEETLEIDNDQPVTSVNAAGATVLNQVVSTFFLIEDFCFALGDPLQPGRLYRSKQADPEAWPATEYNDVCAASEELLNGGQIGSQGFVFSRERMYSILLNADGTWTSEATGCAEGLVGKWAMAITPFGIAFVSPYGIRLTGGGAPERLSDEMIEPLFKGETVRGLSPVDLAQPTYLRLIYHDDELWFTYRDSLGAQNHLIFNFFDKGWRHYQFTDPVTHVYSEAVLGTAGVLLMGGATSGAATTHSGFSDGGTGIPWLFRTGAWNFGQPRNEKLFGEVIMDGDLGTSTMALTPYINDELTALAALAAVGIAGARRYTFDAFGTTPQRARNVSVQFSGTAPTSSRPYINRLGVSYQLQPEITFNLPTPWEEMPGGEGYVWGVAITCDTGGTARSVLVEYTTSNGSVTTAATLSVTASGRKKLPFTFPSVLAQQIRLRPTGICVPWVRYKVEWLTDPEPMRVQGWDSNWEDFGTQADKWIKGYLIQADTFGLAKTVVLDLVDSDGNQQLVQNTLTLTRPGRGVYHHSFAKLRGRMFRLRSTDVNFGKLFKWQPIFDEEPLSLTRWETQERPHQGMEGKWQKPLEGIIAIRSTAAVTLTITAQGYGATVMDTSAYIIPTTGGAKQKVRVPFNAAKGILFTYLLTSASPFWMYREETDLLVEDWLSGSAVWVPMPASNDDLDPARVMGNAAVAAATPGGA